MAETMTSPRIQKAQATQAIKILRSYYTLCIDPWLRAKAKAVPEHPKYLLSVKRYLDRSDKALDAVNTLACEIEAMPE